jgi:uncharacterized membrane protein YhaH (DUF805 family)
MTLERRKGARRWDDRDQSGLWAFLAGVAYGAAMMAVLYVWILR